MTYLVLIVIMLCQLAGGWIALSKFKILMSTIKFLFEKLIEKMNLSEFWNWLI